MIGGFIIRYRYIAGVALLILGISVLLLRPSTPDIDKLREMYERGQYSAVRAQLERELRADPDWYEARELLVLVLLEDGDLDLVLTSLAELRKSGDIMALESFLSGWLRDASLPAEQANSALETVRTGVDANPLWPWLNEFYLELLIKIQYAQEIPGALRWIATAQSGQLSDRLSHLFSAAWSEAAVQLSPGELWQLSVELDYSLPEDSSAWRRRALFHFDLDEVIEAQREFPQDPVLISNLASRQEAQRGLELLREWEKSYSVDDYWLSWYASAKINLLSRAHTVGPKDFRWLSSVQLLSIAVNSIPQPEKCRVILKFLDERNECPEDIEIVRAALRGPKPVFTLQGSRPVLSPDGKWLIIDTDATTARLYNLETKESISLSIADYLGNNPWVWAPDSRMAARVAESYQNSIAVYDIQGELRHQAALEGNYIILGWYDSKTLWVQETDSNDNSPAGIPLLLKIESGEISTSSVDFPLSVTNFCPGPRGCVAWVDSGAINIFQHDKLFKLELNNYAPASWTPDGGSLLLCSSGFPAYFALWTGNEPEPLGIEGAFLGWRSGEEYYWGEGFAGTSECWVRGYNIRTGEVIDYYCIGDSFRQAAAANTIVSGLRGQEIAVYRLP